jgi:hypothetical protein
MKKSKLFVVIILALGLFGGYTLYKNNSVYIDKIVEAVKN